MPESAAIGSLLLGVTFYCAVALVVVLVVMTGVLMYREVIGD